jgi:hypothetical protein
MVDQIQGGKDQEGKQTTVITLVTWRLAARHLLLAVKATPPR